jgi:hypothetical protein
MGVVMVRRYTFGDVALDYNVIDNRHRFLTSDEPDPLVPVEQVIVYEYRDRYFVAQGVTEDLPAVFELLLSDETKAEMTRAERPH